MNKWQKFLLLVSLLIKLFFIVPETQAIADQQDPPVIHAILFFSPTCGACYKVITEELPPLIDQYGNQLQIMGINVTTVEGQDLYQDLIVDWSLPDDKRGVPLLVVGDTYLIGSGEIPDIFPGIIETGLKDGGIDWPDIPGMTEILAQAQQSVNEATSESTNVDPDSTTSPTTEESANDASTMILPDYNQFSMADRFKQDLAGNILAVVVLVGMIISVIWILIRILTPATSTLNDWSWLLPILSILGLIVAGYLSFVEVTKSEAVCGPIGDCNTVQHSPYATLFGFLPVGILGLIGYVALFGAWLLRRYGPESWHNFLTLSIWGMALFGVFFSIYLTYLEPFVIGATCVWCVSSAIIITIQLWASTEPVRQIWAEPEEGYNIDDQEKATSNLSE